MSHWTFHTMTQGTLCSGAQTTPHRISEACQPENILSWHWTKSPTSPQPAGVHLYQAIARRDRTVTRYTYSQVYTTLTKDSSAFKNRPFLLALLLGKDYIKEQPDLSHIYNSTAKLLEYQQIQEAIAMKLTKSEACIEFVLCAPRIEELFSINPATILCQSSQQSPVGYFNRKGWCSIILREQLMLAVKYIRTLDGQVVYMMHVFSNSRLHKKRAKQFPFFRL